MVVSPPPHKQVGQTTFSVLARMLFVEQSNNSISSECRRWRKWYFTKINFRGAKNRFPAFRWHVVRRSKRTENSLQTPKLFSIGSNGLLFGIDVSASVRYFFFCSLTLATESEKNGWWAFETFVRDERSKSTIGKFITEFSKLRTTPVNACEQRYRISVHSLAKLCMRSVFKCS